MNLAPNIAPAQPFSSRKIIMGRRLLKSWATRLCSLCGAGIINMNEDRFQNRYYYFACFYFMSKHKLCFPFVIETTGPVCPAFRRYANRHAIQAQRHSHRRRGNWGGSTARCVCIILIFFDDSYNIFHEISHEKVTQLESQKGCLLHAVGSQKGCKAPFAQHSGLSSAKQCGAMFAAV